MNDGEKKRTKKEKPAPDPVMLRSSYGIAATLAGLLGVIGAIIYSIAYSKDYEPEIMHYRSGSVLIVVAGALLICSVVAALVCGILMRRSAARLSLTVKGSSAVFFSFFTGLMFFAYAVSVIISSKGFPGGRLEIIAFLASIVAGFAMLVRTLKDKMKIPGAILSLFPTVFCVALIFIYYFDLTSAPINSPEKGMTNVVLSAAVLFFIGDSRDRLDRSTAAFAVFSRFVAAFIVAPTALVRIVLGFTSGLSHPPFIVNVLLFASGLYAFYLLVLTGKQIGSGEPDGAEENAAEIAENNQ